MCWNAEASITSWVAGSFVCLMLLQRSDGKNMSADRLYGSFWLLVLFMQLFEYFMWRDPGCTGLNQKASQCAWIQNLAQPAALIFLTLLLIPKEEQRIPRAVLVTLLIVYVACAAVWASKTGIAVQSLCTTANGDCHSLKWPWVRNQEKWIWALYFILLAIGIINIAGGSYTWFATCCILTLLLSIMFAGENFGSWWCIVIVICPLLWYVWLGAACRQNL